MGIYPSTHKSLLKRIQDGDEISWKEFYDRYSPVILNLGSHFGLSATEAEDVRQNVMLKIFQNKLLFSYKEEKARFRTYFNRIVHSCIMDHFRKLKSRNQEISQEELPEQPIPAEAEKFFEEEWRRQRLQEALDILRENVEPQTFLAFHMLVFQQKKVSEVTGFLQLHSSQVYLAKSRCIAKLKKIVEELNTEDPELRVQWDCR